MAWTNPRTWTTNEVVSKAIMDAHVRDNLLETAVAKAAAAGDIPYATAATALTVLTLGTQGYLVVAGASAPEYKGLVKVRKTATEAVNDSTALQDDDELLFAIAANEDWMFELFLITDGPAAADIKFAFTVPAAATLAWAGIGLETTATDGEGVKVGETIEVSGTSVTYGEIGVATKVLVRLYGTVENGANAGNVTLQFAQGGAVATDTKIFANSWLRAEQF